MSTPTILIVNDDSIFSSSNLFLFKTEGEFHVNTKKDTFIKIVMPLILDENNKILENRKIQNPFILNCIISLSVFKTLKQFGVPNLKVKWPNDILSDSKKICGF